MIMAEMGKIAFKFGGATRMSGLALGVFCAAFTAQAQEQVGATVAEIPVPAGPGSSEPSLFALADGRIAVSWTEPTEAGHAVKVALGNEAGWSAPSTVVAAGDLIVNWSDFASVAVLPDGTMAAHWLKETDVTSFSYDVNIALSSDKGETWSAPVVPHRDGTQSQHGFVTLLPVSDSRFEVFWLDGREYGTEDTGAMQLRSASLDADGTLSPESLLDSRACSCCQTSAAVAGDGSILVAYRDRTVEEVRDISVVRKVAGAWSEPRLVHADGWEISGCPVNGPAIDAEGSDAVVAWFTAAQSDPAVKVAFSRDSGASFDAPFRIDGGEAAGRVDTLLLQDGSAVVSWVEWTRLGEILRLCRVTPEDGCPAPQAVALNTAAGSINFPRMAGSGEEIYIAWGQPAAGRTPAGIRMIVARY